MSTASSSTTPSGPITPILPAAGTLADLHRQLGGVPLERIRLSPPLGTATENDVIEAHDRHDRLCELIDGVLVEKTMGYLESFVAANLIHLLKIFVDADDLGFVLAPDAPLRVLPKQVRMPDISFFSWNRFPGRQLPEGQVLAAVPDLAVEILSPSNTRGEMERKLRDYFQSGVRLVWYIDARQQSATIYTSQAQFTEIDSAGKLTGGAVLPGLDIELARILQPAAQQDSSGE